MMDLLQSVQYRQLVCNEKAKDCGDLPRASPHSFPSRGGGTGEERGRKILKCASSFVLKEKLGYKLNRTRIARYPCRLAECRIGHASVNLTQIHPVEQIEELTADFQPVRLVNHKAAVDAEVHVGYARPSERIATKVAFLPRSWRKELRAEFAIAGRKDAADILRS